MHLLIQDPASLHEAGLLAPKILHKKLRQGIIGGRDGEIFGDNFSTVKAKGMLKGKRGGKKPHTEESKIAELQAQGRMKLAFNLLIDEARTSNDPKFGKILKKIVSRSLDDSDLVALKIWKKKFKY